MRYSIEVQYDADPGEDVAAVARVLADKLVGFDGVTRVEVHGEEAVIIRKANAEWPPGNRPTWFTAIVAVEGTTDA